MDSQNKVVLDNANDIKQLEDKFSHLTLYFSPIMIKSLLLALEKLVSDLTTNSFPGLEYATIESVYRIGKNILLVSYFDITKSSLDNYFLIYPKYCGFKQCLQFTSEHLYLGSDVYSNIFSEDKCTKIYLKNEENSFICTESEVLECLFFPENITDCSYDLFENEILNNFELYNQKRLVGAVSKNQMFFNIMLEKEQVYLLSTKQASTFTLDEKNYSLEANLRLLYHYQAVPFALTRNEMTPLNHPLQASTGVSTIRIHMQTQLLSR